MSDLPYDNVVLRFLNKLTDLMVLNILFIICSLPVFTLGASLTAMHTVNLKSVRYGDGYVIKRFFKAFRENFKQSTIAWLLFLALGLLLFFDIRFWQSDALPQALLSYGRVMTAVSYAIAFTLVVLATWLFPVIAKMRDPLHTQISNSFKMAVGFLPYTAICVAIEVLAVYAAIHNLGMMMMMLVFGFALVSYICSFFIYKVFSKLITEESSGYEDLLYEPETEDRSK